MKPIHAAGLALLTLSAGSLLRPMTQLSRDRLPNEPAARTQARADAESSPAPTPAVCAAAGDARGGANSGNTGSSARPSPIAAALACRADFDLSGQLDTTDLFQFLEGYLAGSPLTDIDASGEPTPADISEYVHTWMAGC